MGVVAEQSDETTDKAKITKLEAEIEEFTVEIKFLKKEEDLSTRQAADLEFARACVLEKTKLLSSLRETASGAFYHVAKCFLF
jgi:hypothetical protein